MEERTRRKARTFTIESEFECSRLEKRLLAQVYERIVPSVVEAVGKAMVEDQDSRGLSDRFQLQRTAGGSS